MGALTAEHEFAGEASKVRLSQDPLAHHVPQLIQAQALVHEQQAVADPEPVIVLQTVTQVKLLQRCQRDHLFVPMTTVMAARVVVMMMMMIGRGWRSWGRRWSQQVDGSLDPGSPAGRLLPSTQGRTGSVAVEAGADVLAHDPDRQQDQEDDDDGHAGHQG